MTKQPKTWPAHGWAGILLVGIFWALNWSLTGVRTHWGFFPLWLGYSLLVDAVVHVRKGHSLLSRNPRAFVLLFLVSMPCWWLFEVLNWRTQNWVYLGREQFSHLEYALLASLSFSTVLPAVFGSAELLGTLQWIKGMKTGPRISPSFRNLLLLFLAGWIMLVAVLAWPRVCFPFLWGAVYGILEPINHWLGHRSLFRYLAVGDWRPVVSLCLGALLCGFFWELWNAYSYPKWTYEVPHVGFLHVFEMPLLGYGGYLPFALELYALHALITGLLRLQRTHEPVDF